MRPSPTAFFILLSLAFTGLFSSCTTGFYKKWADREVFGVLEKKASKVPNSGEHLMSITPPEPVNLDELEKNLKTEDFLGDRAFIEKGARKLSLAQSLDYAVHRNRTYLTEKETVYLTALDLTLVRNQFSPILTAGGNGQLTNRRVETGVNQFITESTLTTTGAAGFSALQRTGTRIATDLTTDFFKFITGDLRGVSDSSLAVTLTQPLMRGAGYLSASEPLTQSERDVLYSIRDFTQYRKTFAIETVGQYLRTLQAREAVRNTFLAYTSYASTVENEQMLADTLRRPTKSYFFQVRQAQLSNESRWRQTIRAYEQTLDEFKIQLGLPVEEPLLLDTDELSALEIIDPPGTLDEAMDTALVTRLDLWNARDELEDAERHVRIAHQNILPRVDTTVAYDLTGDPDRSNLNVDGRRRKVTTGLDIDLNLNQTPSRNTLRAAQVAEQRARRNVELQEEQVRRQIRADWRDLQLARVQYDLAATTLSISEERVTLESALFPEGRNTARDLVEAQRDLVDARNGIIAAKITHTLARLQLWADMGILFIRKDGSWAAVMDNEKPKGS